MKRILFVLKYRDNYGSGYGSYFSSGLYWSSKLVVDMLLKSGIEAKLVQVVDNNSIDREVSLFKPDVVIIEALWVIPEKFTILQKLHPNVKWVVRLHSNIPFLANEGIAIEWIKQYADRGVTIAANSKQLVRDLECLIYDVLYLPNFYPVQRARPFLREYAKDRINICCYGAIRPLKNQLLQATAAIQFANSIGKNLNFYINSTRVEMGGNPVLKNLRSLFTESNHTLVQDAWMSHDEFLRRLRIMDIGMQVSLTETFSIVAADMVSVGIPSVFSKEVRWASKFTQTSSATDGRAILDGLERAYSFPQLSNALNRHNLKSFSNKSEKIWHSCLTD